MQHIHPVETMQRALRARVCTQCWMRPPGSETLSSDVPRACEPECTIFINLPRLRKIAHTVTDTSLGLYEQAVQELVCQTCESSPTSGDYCAERTTRNCPLSRYLGEVIDALEKIPHVPQKK